MMKKIVAVLLTAVMILSANLVSDIPQASAAVQYTVYASPDGSGSDCSLESPCSLTGVQSKVRSLNATMTGDIEVILRGGQYYLSTPLTLTELDSGRNGFQVIWKNYALETPEILGAAPVTGWVLDSGSIYKANVGTGLNIHTLYENGVRATKARYPNTGYLFDEQGSGGIGDLNYSQGWFIFRNGQLPNWSDMVGGEVYVWGYWDWFSSTLPITAFDYTNRKVTLSRPPFWGLIDVNTAPYGFKQGANDRYYIQNVKSALDVAGEYYYDSNAGYLYYYPRTLPASIEDQEVLIPLMKNIIEIKGSSTANLVENVQFEGITVRGSDFTHSFDSWADPPAPPLTREHDGPAQHYESLEPVANRHGNIYLENAAHITLKSMVISDSGYSGIIISNYCQDIVVFGTQIHDVGFHGISIVGKLDNFDPAVNKYNLISNNHIYNVGQLVGHGAGISIQGSGYNTVSHNELHDGPRHGLHIMGSYSLSSIQNTNSNNLIEYNHIYDFNYDSGDTGNIYTTSSGRYNKFDHNLIHGNHATGPGAIAGIFLDDHTDYAIATNNIFYDTVQGVHQNNNAPTITLSNNVHSNNPALWAAAGLDSSQMGIIIGMELAPGDPSLRGYTPPPSNPHNLALPANGGNAAASSQLSTITLTPATLLNDDDVIAYWNDNTQSTYPDWAEINWTAPRTVKQVTLRLPVMPTHSSGQRTIGSMTVQYKDGSGIYQDIHTITNWAAPTSNNGTQIRTVTLPSSVSTTAIRVKFTSGNSDGWSFLEEIQVYGPSSNLALPMNGGSAAASSSLTLYGGTPPSLLNDNGANGYWNDGTQSIYPDWSEINWTEPQEVKQVTLRLPVMPTLSSGQRTIGSMTVQYKDGSGNYQDIDTITNWVAPTSNDGTQIKSFTLPSTVNTTAIRVKFTNGNSEGWSFLEEIQVYGPSSNLALPMNGGTAAASSSLTLYGGTPPYLLNDNGVSGYWNDNTQSSYPDWAEIYWSAPQTVNQVTLRLPVMPTLALELRTIGSMTLQYKDGSGIYQDIHTITNWVAPTSSNGMQIRTVTLPSTVNTTAIRVKFASGNSEGWSFLEEIEVYGP